MEEKLKRRFPTLRSIFNRRYSYLSFLGKSNYSKTSSTFRNLKTVGFTLIELLVVIMILSVLVGFVLVTLNPLTQIRKSQDAQRQHDLKQIQTGFDSYYNDNNYYPQSTSSLISTKTIQTLPNDPVVSSGWPNYGYVEDQNSNPQWNVLFAKLAFPSTGSFSCPLEQMNNCLPNNYTDKGYNYCIISGNVNCSQIESLSITPITPLPVTVTPTATPTPTPPPFYCYCKDATYWKDITKLPSHQCQVVQPSSDPSINFDRYCSSPCVNPCTQ